jgi:hypothetical protein
MPLTDVACRNSACPAGKQRVRLTDGAGLYLEVAPNGSRRWFWKYYLGAKEKRLALGHYTRPESSQVAMTLKEAREARDEARKLLQKGIDPAQQQRLVKLTAQAASGQSFEFVARELHATKRSAWSPQYAARWIERMEKDLFPWIGSLPLSNITAPLLLQTLRRIESRGAHETAHTLRQTAGQVFRYGIATGRCERNPSPDLHGALKPIVVKHMAAVLDPEGVRTLMRAIDSYEGAAIDQSSSRAFGTAVPAAGQHSADGVGRARPGSCHVDHPSGKDEAHASWEAEWSASHGAVVAARGGDPAGSGAVKRRRAVRISQPVDWRALDEREHAARSTAAHGLLER